MGKLDIHVHLATQPCPVCFFAQERINFDRMMGIDRGILLSEPAAAGGCLETDEAALQWAQAAMGPMDAYAVSLRYPERFAWMCNVYLDGTDAPYEHLKRYKELGACGVGEFTQSLRLDDPQMERLFAWCQELELPFLFHMRAGGGAYGVVDLPGLPLLEGALKKFPGVKFIGHSQPFWAEIGQHPADLTDGARGGYPSGRVVPGRVHQLLEGYGNLYGDLSADSGGNAILRDPDHGLEFLERFQDRLMYGSDTVASQSHYPLGLYLDSLLRQSKLSAEAYAKICRTNAERVFGI